jgi:nicotinic acid mononucleotide adenylyltransferase
MPNVTQEHLVKQIHDSGARMVVAVTGGGSGAISALLSVGGASRSVLAAAVPYAEAALVEWLGAKPEEFCSSRTARAMAMAAFGKAQAYDPGGRSLGVACSASLASDRPKRGAHRAHLAYQTATTTATLSIELKKGLRSRADEEAIVGGLLLNLIAGASGVSDRLDVPLAASEAVTTASIAAPPELQDLLAGRKQAVTLRGGQVRSEIQESPAAVFPGAFNPLHSGHERMAETASRLLHCGVDYEISIANVDKPPLDFIEIHERLRQFRPDQSVWLTRAPLFMQKAELFPGATFVVGADTIARIGQARYYDDSPERAEAAISQIAAHGCRFLVFGRQDQKRFLTLQDLAIPRSLAEICQQVPEVTFREDISSTELRHRERSP